MGTMRAVLFSTLIFFLTSAAAIPALAEQRRYETYFPLQTWWPDAERHRQLSGWEYLQYSIFIEGWFGSHLFAMDEPPLHRVARSKGSQTAHVRLLVLPSFSPSSAIRLSYRNDGTGSVSLVTMDGAGGYEPGGVALKLQSDIENEDSSHIELLLDEIGLWQSHRHDKPADKICFDGTTLVFEIARGGYYHALSAHGCDITDELNELAKSIDGLVQVEILNEWVWELPTSSETRQNSCEEHTDDETLEALCRGRLSIEFDAEDLLPPDD